MYSTRTSIPAKARIPARWRGLLARGSRGALAGLFLALSGSLGAATRTWNNTSTDANAAGSWTGGPPGAADIALFNTAVTNNPNLTGNGSVLGLQFDSGSGAYTFSGSGAVRTLTIGSS